MTGSLVSASVRRRTVDPILAVLTVALAVVWVTEPGFVFDGGVVAAAVIGSAFVPATLLVSGFFAVSVLARVV